jgi:hypothetical protein
VKREERRLVSYIHSSSAALLDAKTRGQEHAARYLFSVAIEQLYRWANEQASAGRSSGEAESPTRSRSH